MSEMQRAPNFSKLDELEFVVKNEPWTKFKLEDGTKLFVKYVLTKVYRIDSHDPDGEPAYVPSGQNIFVTIVGTERKGIPSNPVPTSPNAADYDTVYVDFERIGNEEWNSYEFSDGTIYRIKIEPTAVLRTDKFAPDGDPFYLINSGTIPRIKVPQDLMKKHVPKISSASPSSHQDGIYK
jgi:hypothetical protein